MGVGNQVSCEFNLIYRWHAAVSDRDDKWTQMFTAKVFPGQDMSKISLEDFKLGLSAWGKSIDPNPWTRTWGGLVRDKTTGGFDDAALIKIITESTEDCAGM
jgi:hypothetical protein